MLGGFHSRPFRWLMTLLLVGRLAMPMAWAAGPANAGDFLICAPSGAASVDESAIAAFYESLGQEVPSDAPPPAPCPLCLLADDDDDVVPRAITSAYQSRAPPSTVTPAGQFRLVPRTSPLPLGARAPPASRI